METKETSTGKLEITYSLMQVIFRKCLSESYIIYFLERKCWIAIESFEEIIAQI